MDSKNAQYLDEMVKIIKEQIYLQGKGRQQFLLENNAIKIVDGDEVVIANYPKLVYFSKGEEQTHDEGGDMLGLITKMEAIQKQGMGTGHHINYYPRFYSFYIMADDIIQKIIKDLSARCEVCETKSWLKSENRWCNCVINYLKT